MNFIIIEPYITICGTGENKIKRTHISNKKTYYIRTTNMNLSVCVFGSSSNRTPDNFLKAGYELGKLLARKKYNCINGGGRFGVMGAINRGVIESKGMSIGVIHSKWIVDVDEMQSGMTKMIVADGDNLVERKRLLFEHSDCFISLPGGPGTFDELFEFICEKQLGFHDKPVVIVNIDGYYDGIVNQLEAAKQNQLLHSNVENMVYVCSNIEDALLHCEVECRKNKEEIPKKVIRQRRKKMNDDDANNDNTTNTFNMFTNGMITGAVLTFSILKFMSRM